MRYHNITKDDMKNGDGLRVVLWVAGCPHKCEGCHNPVTWDENGGISFDEAAEQELYEAMDKSYISGITFSGGDPLYEKNIDGITRLAQKIKEKFPNKTIWLYTGFRWREVRELEVMNYLDVLVDGKYIQEQRDSRLYWRGSANQRVIDVPESKRTGCLVLHAE